jgi:hypothetical protein
MPDRVPKCDPKVQKPQTRYDAAHRSIRRIDGKGGVLHKERVLVPESVRPGRITNRQADVHAQQDAQEQFGSLKPARNALRAVFVRGNGGWGIRCGHGNRTGCDPWLWSRARGHWRRCHFRLLGHSIVTSAVTIRPKTGVGTRPGDQPSAQGRRIATVSQQACLKGASALRLGAAAGPSAGCADQHDRVGRGMAPPVMVSELPGGTVRVGH